MKSSSQRRYEILLPLRFNDGKAVPDDLIVDTLLELEEQFESISAESAPVQDVWRHQGKRYRDDLLRVQVDVHDTRRNRRFFQSYKKTLEDRFQQIEIRITSHLIEVVE